MEGRSILRAVRDPSWEFVGVLVSVIALVVSIAPVILREGKALEVTLLADASAVKVENRVADSIVVYYRGRQVKNLSLLTVKIENSGGEPIEEADYARPVSFIFPEGAQIVEAKVVDAFPVDLGITVQAKGNRASLSESLLNSGDQAVIQFSVADIPSGAKIPFRVSGRIAGLKLPQVRMALELDQRPPAVLLRALNSWQASMIAAIILLIVSAGALLGRVSWGIATIVAILVGIVSGASTIASLL